MGAHESQKRGILTRSNALSCALITVWSRLLTATEQSIYLQTRISAITALAQWKARAHLKKDWNVKDWRACVKFTCAKEVTVDEGDQAHSQQWSYDGHGNFCSLIRSSLTLAIWGSWTWNNWLSYIMKIVSHNISLGHQQEWIYVPKIMQL